MRLGASEGIEFKQFWPHFAGVFGCRRCVCTLEKKKEKKNKQQNLITSVIRRPLLTFLEACVAFKVGIQGILMACDCTINWVSKSNGL